MTTTNKQHPTAVLIAGITPYFLERGVLWFEEHYDDIRKKSRSDEWWRMHTAFVEVGAHLPFSQFLRKLADMGYVKVHAIDYPGCFAVRGGIADVFPINRGAPVRIEFIGNRVEAVFELPMPDFSAIRKATAPKDATEHERLWLAHLKAGDYVVHIDHGIGMFRGFATNDEIVGIDGTVETVPKHNAKRASISSSTALPAGRAEIHQAKPRLPSGQGSNNYYIIEYAAARRGGRPDRLLLPREQAQKLSRYIGFDTPVIHRLGGSVWEGTLRRAKADAVRFAEELIAILRSRAGASRPPYPEHREIERHLEHSFQYEETDDQLSAIRDIHADLSKEKPMDRLLVGDVGFGKTEVLLRAAARVAYAGKQVALLAPTTILADQHFTTARERFRGLPIRVSLLSRLTPKRDERHAIREIENGTVDVVVGTHRLLSRDVRWRDLGLVVIDEEQRFGVKQKEVFKELRAEVDILSLSATPIPRTLSLALAKFRDISLIQNPPLGRLPIQTFVLPYSERIVAEAISAEQERRGQIFYLWNRIENIESIKRKLERISPKSVIAILHGRMRERELIRVMHEFRSGAIDILLATTIIENGLDFPSVNTLIVANAARLGLAQAHQIRGRIGRGSVPARAYFLYPPRSLNEKSAMRLAALREAEELGSGFSLALKDLEIRGAGNVLGKQQSGAVNRVGLNLYAAMLGEALEEIRPAE